MKKAFVILSILALAACNGNGVVETSDSTVVDSVVVVDTVAVADSVVTVDTAEVQK